MLVVVVFPGLRRGFGLGPGRIQSPDENRRCEDRAPITLLSGLTVRLERSMTRGKSPGIIPILVSTSARMCRLTSSVSIPRAFLYPARSRLQLRRLMTDAGRAFRMAGKFVGGLSASQVRSIIQVERRLWSFFWPEPGRDCRAYLLLPVAQPI